MSNYVWLLGCVFDSNKHQVYTYRHDRMVPIGARVIVKSPINGLTCVTVRSCTRSDVESMRDPAAFKHIVSEIGNGVVREYERKEVERMSGARRSHLATKIDEMKKSLEQLEHELRSLPEAYL